MQYTTYIKKHDFEKDPWTHEWFLNDIGWSSLNIQKEITVRKKWERRGGFPPPGMPYGAILVCRRVIYQSDNYSR